MSRFRVFIQNPFSIARNRIRALTAVKRWGLDWPLWGSMDACELLVVQEGTGRGDDSPEQLEIGKLD